MIEYQDECADCAAPGYPCMGAVCQNKKVPHYICDWCKWEEEAIYHYKGDEVCIRCIEKDLRKVEG